MAAAAEYTEQSDTVDPRSAEHDPSAQRTREALALLSEAQRHRDSLRGVQASDPCGESASLGLGHHFGIRARRRHRSGARFGCRSTALRLASLRSATAEPSGERTTPREFPFISILFLLALLIN